MDEVYVVEVSTTGPKGAPADAIGELQLGARLRRVASREE